MTQGQLFDLKLTQAELEVIRALLALAKSYPGPKNTSSIGILLESALDSALLKVQRLMEGR
jgi:hypothetical protein